MRCFDSKCTGSLIINNYWLNITGIVHKDKISIIIKCPECKQKFTTIVDKTMFKVMK